MANRNGAGMVRCHQRILHTELRWSEEDSWQLTGQLVPGTLEILEVGQVANALWQLCRNELFSREILRTGFGWYKVLTGQLVIIAIELLQILEISDRFRELCQIRVFSFSATAYWVWWSEEGSWKLTGQLILGAVEPLELDQIADALG